jgi:hypothetical protein
MEVAIENLINKYSAGLEKPITINQGTAAQAS